GCVAQKHLLHCGISRSSSKMTGFTIFGTRAANAQRNFGAHQRFASHPFVNLVGHRGALGLKADVPLVGARMHRQPARTGF
ncbi:hypothetical protein ACC736_39080, partial [Rhizobium ruizarguesonis]